MKYSFRKFCRGDYWITVRHRTGWGDFAVHITLARVADEGLYVGVEGTGKTLKEAFAETRRLIKLYRKLLGHFKREDRRFRGK